MDVVTQIEGAAGQHPFLAKVVLAIAFVVALKGWGAIGPLVMPTVNRFLVWLSSLKPNSTPPVPSTPPSAPASSHLAAIQSLFVAAMSADAPDDAFENVVAIAKAYKAKATSGASSL